jgi:hypothetical protein
VEEIIAWLRHEYGTNRIYTHIDTDTNDVWLNLDWGPDEKGNAHPGGPFYQGDKNIVLCIRDNYGKTPLKLPDSYSAPAPVTSVPSYATENVAINATEPYSGIASEELTFINDTLANATINATENVTIIAAEPYSEIASENLTFTNEALADASINFT